MYTKKGNITVYSDKRVYKYLKNHKTTILKPKMTLL